jgi:hypothetical protein
MRHYQCHFLGRRADQFHEGPEFQSLDDRAALLEAHRLTAEREYFYASLELWEGGRLVSVWPWQQTVYQQ